MELIDAIRARRMVRSFSSTPLDPALVDGMLDLARRAPSAGFSQGVEFLVLETVDTERFWSVVLPADERAGFPWPGLLDAPVLVLPLADERAYLERYAEPDKAGTGLGGDVDAWPVPWWQLDAAMAVQNLLLLATDAGLGALLFGIFRNEDELCELLGIPPGVRPIGAVALGRPSGDDRPSGSLRRGRRPLGGLVHRGRYRS